MENGTPLEVAAGDTIRNHNYEALIAGASHIVRSSEILIYCYFICAYPYLPCVDLWPSSRLRSCLCLLARPKAILLFDKLSAVEQTSSRAKANAVAKTLPRPGARIGSDSNFDYGSGSGSWPGDIIISLARKVTVFMFCTGCQPVTVPCGA